MNTPQATCRSPARTPAWSSGEDCRAEASSSLLTETAPPVPPSTVSTEPMTRTSCPVCSVTSSLGTLNPPIAHRRSLISSTQTTSASGESCRLDTPFRRTRGHGRSTRKLAGPFRYRTWTVQTGGKFVKATSNLSRDRIELKFPITGAETMEMHDLCSPYQGFDEANVARARQE